MEVPDTLLRAYVRAILLPNPVIRLAGPTQDGLGHGVTKGLFWWPAAPVQRPRRYDWSIRRRPASRRASCQPPLRL